jgi:hypothetical protein
MAIAENLAAIHCELPVGARRPALSESSQAPMKDEPLQQWGIISSVAIM